MDYLHLALQFKNRVFTGRYLVLETVLTELQKFKNGSLTFPAQSVLKQPIPLYTIGFGKTKILMWSQMHGNESTTTKAVFDFLAFLNSGSELSDAILTKITFYIIPMLNPDGAKLYTRENANGVDLNRDAQQLSQPESILLRNLYEQIQPHFCFNLHDQRSIFGVGDLGLPATVSFLAPSFNNEREVNSTRLKAMRIIEDMNFELQKIIPNQIGRFDDQFNLNCVGDTFQFLGTPTILFEAGHFQADYNREKTREFLFISFVVASKSVSEIDVVRNDSNEYLSIPQNKVNFYDFIYNNVKIIVEGNEKIINFAIQYNEVLNNASISFIGIIVKINTLEGFYGHQIVDANHELYFDGLKNYPKINEIANFSLNNSPQFVKGIKIK